MSNLSDPTGQPHKPADDNEAVYFEGSPMLRGEMGKLFGFGLLGLAIIAGSIVGGLTFPPAFAGIAVGIIVLFVPWLFTKTIRYRITNYRIDFERGLVSKKIDTLELWHVEDVQFSQSILERITGVGTITIISHDETTPRLVMSGLPERRPLFDALKQRIISVKRQRGVIKMDVG